MEDRSKRAVRCPERLRMQAQHPLWLSWHLCTAVQMACLISMAHAQQTLDAPPAAGRRVRRRRKLPAAVRQRPPRGSQKQPSPIRLPARLQRGGASHTRSARTAHCGGRGDPRRSSAWRPSATRWAPALT